MDLTPKAIRQAHASLEQLEVKLYQFAAMLNRFHYKSKAQHRRANWFQSMGGMKKCMTRILEVDRIALKVADSLPERSAASNKRSKYSKGQEAKETSLSDAKMAMSRLWSHFWAETGNSDGR
jgi:hypothetical protein